jgi:hypothetical protein
MCCAEKTCSCSLPLAALPVGLLMKVKPPSVGVPSLSFLLRPPQFNRML